MRKSKSKSSSTTLEGNIAGYMLSSWLSSNGNSAGDVGKALYGGAVVGESLGALFSVIAGGGGGRGSRRTKAELQEDMARDNLLDRLRAEDKKADQYLDTLKTHYGDRKPDYVTTEKLRERLKSEDAVSLQSTRERLRAEDEAAKRYLATLKP